MSKARLVITAVTVQGLSQAEAARRYGLSQAWVSRLMARWRAEGQAAFEPRSRRPHTSPRAVPDGVVAAALTERDRLVASGHDAARRPSAGTWSGPGSRRRRGPRSPGSSTPTGE